MRVFGLAAVDTIKAGCITLELNSYAATALDVIVCYV